jgi:saccharopine dehydrogenase-like NADP-dependent oxidoreductase
MIEKTLRYPGHIELMKIFREVGFFSDREIEVAGKAIRPIDLTSKLLFPFWSPGKGEEDFTILDLLIEGEEKGKKSSHRYFIFDHFDKVNKTSSMARTTGFTCCAAARFLLETNFKKQGICPPEFLGEYENCYNYILSYLSKKGIAMDHSEK